VDGINQDPPTNDDEQVGDRVTIVHTPVKNSKDSQFLSVKEKFTFPHITWKIHGMMECKL
jgi:hypothetical protein